MCILVLVELINATSSPFTTWKRAEHPIREMRHLIVPVQLLPAHSGVRTCTANERLLLEGKEKESICEGASRRFL